MKSAGLTGHTIHSCKALREAGPGSTICRRAVRAGGTWRDVWKALNSLQQAAVMAPKDLA